MAIVEEGPKGRDVGMLGALAELDRLLRGELTRVASLRRGEIELSPRRLSMIVVSLGMIYGVCMGTFALSRLQAQGVLQVVASMIKVPLLFYLTLLVTLPSLYVFNALVGSRLSMATVVRLLVASLAVMVAVLSSLGPIVAFFSVSTTSYPFMVLFNVVVFAVSGGLGLLFLLQTLHRLSVAHSESPLIVTPEAHVAQDSPGALDPMEERVLSGHVKTVFRTWVIVFGLVGAQMGWVLRPFIGNPHVPFTFLRGRESNFFQAVLHALANLFS